MGRIGGLMDSAIGLGPGDQESLSLFFSPDLDRDVKQMGQSINHPEYKPSLSDVIHLKQDNLNLTYLRDNRIEGLQWLGTIKFWSCPGSTVSINS